MNPVHVIDTAALDAIIERKLAQVEYLSSYQVQERYSLSSDLLDKLVRERKVKRYVVPDHPRVVRYRKDEIEKLFIEQ